MKLWTLIFVLLAVIAATFAFGGLDPLAAPAAEVLFFFFAVLGIASLVGWLSRNNE